jgi:hypothetical protein
LVDDATRYVTLYFLKAKSEATQYVKNYLTHLHVRGIVPVTTSSQVLCGPEICHKSLAEFFLIRNMPKECDLRCLIFPVPTG